MHMGARAVLDSWGPDVPGSRFASTAVAVHAREATSRPYTLWKAVRTPVLFRKRRRSARERRGASPVGHESPFSPVLVVLAG